MPMPYRRSWLDALRPERTPLAAHGLGRCRRGASSAGVSAKMRPFKSVLRVVLAGSKMSDVAYVGMSPAE